MKDNNKKTEKKQVEKYRYYFVVAYPEHFNNTNNPQDICDYLSLRGVDCVVSTLHDKDVYDKDIIEKDKDGNIIFDVKKGQPKKPHFHVLLYWKNQKTKNKAKEFCKLYNLFYLDKDFVVSSQKGCIQYCIHLKNDNKHKYEILPISNYLSETQIREIIYGSMSKADTLKAIFQILRTQKIKHYHIALTFLLENNVEYVDFFVKNQGLFNNYFRSVQTYYYEFVQNEKLEKQYQYMCNDYANIITDFTHKHDELQNMQHELQQALIDVSYNKNIYENFIENNKKSS